MSSNYIDALGFPQLLSATRDVMEHFSRPRMERTIYIKDTHEQRHRN